MAVIGTAGHVDHGKSTLLQAITGRDPDRWEEEKRRGLTIDLGFAWTTLPSGRQVSFIDVPGHERFIKNMLAGIEAIDVVLFVVAADEGWMPQSEEHLAVVDLLGVQRGVVALTKVDRVTPDLVELATLEVSEHLEGTGLEGARMIPVSARDHIGVDEVAAALDSLVPPDPGGDDPRLWIDRRFTIEGAGTIVTGTLLGGPIAVGDRLEVHPGERTIRVRGIESHETSAETVGPGRRVALNIVGADDDLARGHMLGRVGRWAPTRRFTAAVTPARYVDELSERGAHHLHVGSLATPVRLRAVGDGYLVVSEHALPLRYGDRFVVRETGRRAVVAGGVVLDPDPPLRGAPLRRAGGISPNLTPKEAATSLLELRGSDDVTRLNAHTGSDAGAFVVVGSTAVTPSTLERVASRAVEEVDRFHETSPLRPGLPVATLASRLDVAAELVHHVIGSSEMLETTEGIVRRRGRRVHLTPDQRRAWARAQEMLGEGGLLPPRVDDLPIDVELVHQLVRDGELVRISEEFVYLPDDASRLRGAIEGMDDEFTVADFRDALGLSRKYAVPILEWADHQGLTRRHGDHRTPSRPSSVER